MKNKIIFKYIFDIKNACAKIIIEFNWGKKIFLQNRPNEFNKRNKKLLKYICHHCDNLECETSKCPNCGNRTDLLESTIFYCKKCNVPIFDEECDCCHAQCERIGSDIRPVFAQERLLLEVLLNKPFAFAGKSIWCSGANNYIVDGKRIRVSFSELSKKNPDEVIKKLNELSYKNKQYVDSDFSNENIQRFIECNRIRLNQITTEATDYIRNIASNFDASSMFVSFSGGKDSSVTSHLVMRALNNYKIIHIYGDTTLEYPTSAELINKFRKEYPTTPVLVAKNMDQDFENLCEVVGPPSRVMRWCCTVFKTGAITKKIESTFKNKTRLLSFQGIRRVESLARSKYDRDTDSPKISKQLVSAPIIDWTDFDVWLYLLTNKVPFNNAYRQGFSRVGCWCCPNNSGWSEFLSSIYMNEQFVKFRGMLYKFAKHVGKEDWKEYIDSGNWKARQGGNGLEHSKNAIVEFKPCALDESSINFELTRPISEDLYTFFKPFGKIDFSLGNKRLNEVYILNRTNNMPLIRLSGKIGSSVLKVTLLSTTPVLKNIKVVGDLVRNQITKYQTCIGCSYCAAVCKFNALKVFNLEKGNVGTNTISYSIDPSRCVGCLECVKHFDGGCYMKKVLRTKKGE